MTQEEAYTNLAHAIIAQAGDDWRRLGDMLLKGKKPEIKHGKKRITFGSLRKFFHSSWCDVLCGEVEPKKVIKRLEAELTATQEKLARMQAAGITPRVPRTNRRVYRGSAF